ncbi:hypothetical protein B0H13DRAFT_2665984 [Mycena leptocephala]|nr:hypothetical protein B0H13DRAFT_2665984 [Mycena leptocephala]
MDAGVEASYNLQLVSRVDVGMLTALVGFLVGGVYVGAACDEDGLMERLLKHRLVWKSPWSPIKCLYLWARYSTFVDTALSVHIRTQLDVDPSQCHTATSFIRIFAVIGTIITELILTIRTYALYGRSPYLLIFLSVMWLLIGGINIWALIKWTQSLIEVALSPVNSCNLDSPSNIGVVCYLSLLIGETVVVLLTVWRGLRTFSLSRSAYRHSHLVTTFYRDGILFYLAIFGQILSRPAVGPSLMQMVLVILVVDVSLESQAPAGLKFIADSPLRVMQSILACHLVLHARAVGLAEALGEDTITVNF